MKPWILLLELLTYELVMFLPVLGGLKDKIPFEPKLKLKPCNKSPTNEQCTIKCKLHMECQLGHYCCGAFCGGVCMLLKLNGLIVGKSTLRSRQILVIIHVWPISWEQDDGQVSGHLPLHSSTFSWRNVALLLLLFLSLEQTSASPSNRAKKKPGACLQERITCNSKAPDLCKTDFNCDEHLKCCSFACGKKCMDPSEEPCLLPLDTGHCKKTVKQWYFNTEQRVCKPFFYGGCLGNANSFSKKEDCMKACSSVVKDGQCPLFPFKNRMECSASCKSDYDCPLNEKCCESMCGFACAMAWTDVCTLPKVPGPCNAFFVRWWYDQQKEICSSFIYGGCQGNNNNFQSEGVCRAICPRRSKSQSPC
ncbi:hypothetical protein G4228_015657 [Cervus hanglu yarkandensis]|nr:hypothetical protein G4228_015657 [Cervus hanglu yarkandensis]